jgi:DNA-binding XRE family transcriptional regulator
MPFREPSAWVTLVAIRVLSAWFALHAPRLSHPGPRISTQHIGVTRQTVNAIELGKYSPSPEAAFRIARVFGVPLEKVFQYNPARGSE